MNNVYKVGQINAYIKNMFSQDFLLRSIYVKGEVSNVKYHSSGHIYFTLKDDKGTISCVMFAGNRQGLSFHMNEGQQVVVNGSIEVYERDGKYQLYAKNITLDGLGALYERFDALKKELEEMGMFSEEYKRPLPKYAKRIGIITSPTGAAIRDIIKVAKQRNPYVELILYPALVQGEAAGESIVNGIIAMEQQQVDVIIVGRGGGSIEDLWAFNEEIVARAIFDCQIPVISAVGHETDFTIADFVADFRAPTPSAAAEAAVFEIEEYERRRKELEFRIQSEFIRKLENKKHFSRQLITALEGVSPQTKLREKRMYSISLNERLITGMQKKISVSRHQLAVQIEQMKALSPLNRLQGGYAYLETTDGKRVKTVQTIKEGEGLLLHLTDGRVVAQATKVIPNENCVL